MQPSSCPWNSERDGDRFYLQDGAEIGGNWVETLAVNKSKRYIVMGAYFPASILPPHLFHTWLSYCFTPCVRMWRFHISWDDGCVRTFHREHLEDATSYGECLLQTQHTPYNFLYFSHHYSSVKHSLLLPALSCTCAGLFKATEFYFLPWPWWCWCWHVCVRVTKSFSLSARAFPPK